MSMGKKWAIGCAVVLVLYIIGLMMESSRRNLPDGDSQSASAMGEKFARDFLKAPSTAKFNNTSAHFLGDGEWHVIGDVDSQNGFGAMLRNKFDCDIKYQGYDKWHMIRPCYFPTE